MALTPPPSLPTSLYRLFTDQTAEARHFRTHIRAYNIALTFTSCMYKSDQRINPNTGGIRTFSVQGEVYHLTGRLCYPSDQRSAFAGLYFHDPVYAAQCRANQYPNLRIELLQRLEQIIRDVNNPFINMYMTARELLRHQLSQHEDVRVLINPQMR